MDKEMKEHIFSIIRHSKAAMTNKEIISKLGHDISKTSFKKALNSLKQEGRVIRSNKGKLLCIENSDYVIAEIISQAQNFSFAKSLIDGKEIFISKYDINCALIGDRVLINKVRSSEKGLSGSVKKIIESGKHIVTGKAILGDLGLEFASDSSIRDNIPIKKGFTLGAKAGDKIKVIIARDSANKSVFAKVLKVYGKADTARVCADAVIDSLSIPISFPEDVEEEAKRVSEFNIDKNEMNFRLDLRNETIFTIDGADAKDLDDAISVKKTDYGWELGVHIADVSHYVKFGSKLDREAFERGTSVYFVDRVIPMLPVEISNGVCSLNAGEDKLTISAIVELNENGEIIEYKFYKSIINSKVRGVYSEVNEILNGSADENVLKKYYLVIDSIYLAQRLFDILSKNSESRGVVSIDSGESKFTVDQDGICVGVKPRLQGVAESIIEKFMITANSAVAMHAKSLDLPFVYRVHEEPDKSKLEILAKLSGLLGLKSGKIRKGVKPYDLSQLIKEAEGAATRRVISRQVLQTMAKARYDSKALGHFGLAIADYCHFTSPIRRYPDLYIHRILKDAVGGKSAEKISNKYIDSVNECSKQSTLCEIRAMKAEREAEKYYMAEFMSKHVGECYKAIISGANSKGLFAELENSVTGFIDLSCYKNCKFVFDGMASHIDIYSKRKISIGDEVNIKVIMSNISSGKINFMLIEDDN